MRAKRSKKYRKLMHQYELAFGFREPYQVLVDSNLLRAVHSFKMELIPALERTLQGQVKPLLTKCSLAAIMANQPTNPRTNNTVRPDFLPPPTTLPLRHCSHNPDSTPIDEANCLLSLLSPQTDIKRNKEHYTLATSDPPAPKAQNNQDGSKKRKRGDDEALEALKRAQGLRRAARSIPGVPIVYVKRSVMILEPMSAPSEGIREGVEQDKFRVGLNDPRKEREKAGSAAAAAGEGEGVEKKKKREMKGPKGPNPLSMKKPKKRADEAGSKPKREKLVDDAEKRDGEDKVDEDGEAAPKAKRRRHRGANKFHLGNNDEGPAETAIDAED